MTTPLHKICKRFDFSAEVCPCHFSKALFAGASSEGKPPACCAKVAQEPVCIFCAGRARELKNASCINNAALLVDFRVKLEFVSTTEMPFAAERIRGGGMRDGKNRVKFIFSAVIFPKIKVCFTADSSIKPAHRR